MGNESTELEMMEERLRSIRSFGLTNDVSGDMFLLTKEVDVPGFLGASQNRFESDSGSYNRFRSSYFGIILTVLLDDEG